VRLDEPTPPELETIERDTASVWAHGLSVDEYAAREVALFAHPWARGALRKRVLRERTGGPVLASFDALETECAAGRALTIASVFVEPALRGRDHARTMLELALAEAAADGVVLAVLFSDIGFRFYERLGFGGGPASYAWFDARGAAPPAPPAAGAGPPLEPVALADLGAAVEAVRAFRASLARDVTMLPTAGLLGWHLERFRFFARLRGAPWPRTLGLRAPSGALALFAPNARDRTLEVFSLVARDPRDARALLLGALAAARVAALARVVVWLGPDHPDPGPDLRPARTACAFAMARPLAPLRPSPAAIAGLTFAPFERIDWA